MVKFKFAVLAAAAIASGAASAATQGTLGTTSTGTFINTFTGATAQVQVLGLKDALVTPASGKVPTSWEPRVGIQDKFCVVNTGGGATKITFSNANGKFNTYAFNSVSPEGNKLPYFLTVWGNGIAKLTNNLNSSGYILPAAQAVTNAAACGEGNMNKAVAPTRDVDFSKVTKTFVDTMTVIATPQ